MKLRSILPPLRRPDDSDSASVSHRLRKARFAWIQQMLDEIISERSIVRVLDVGGRAQYWRLLDPNFYDRVHVTILNLEIERGFELNGPEGLKIESRTGDACKMPEIDEHSFDLCHSNSVIEHVGSFYNMICFAEETRRVAKFYYHQTPNLWFPIEPHYGVPFFHWLPKALRATLFERYKIGYGGKAPDLHTALQIVDHTEIVTPSLMARLFPEAELLRERYFGFCKSIAVRGRTP